MSASEVALRDSAFIPAGAKSDSLEGGSAAFLSGVFNRTLGGILGSAVCDSLGALVEFQRPGTFAPVDAGTLAEWRETRQPQPNPWKLRAGQFTDGE